MVNHYAMMGGMASQHRHKSRGFRPDPGEYEAAAEHLERRGRTPGAYLRACLRWLDADPDAALAAVGPFWPDVRPTGRPTPHHTED